jgi:hypothetical protein
VGVWKDAAAATNLPPLQLKRVYWYGIGTIDEWNLADPKAQFHLHERFEADRDLKRIYLALARIIHQEAESGIAGRVLARTRTAVGRI